MVSRSAHSLVELLVALTVLSLVLGAVTSGAFLAYRGSGRAIRAQVAASRTAALLDSLLASPRVVDGGTVGEDGLRTTWSAVAVGHGAAVLIRTVTPAGAELVRLEGFWLRDPPPLPGGDSILTTSSTPGTP